MTFPLSLQNKRVAVFGGSSGIGLAVAAQAKAQGSTLTLVSRNPDRLGEAQRQIGGAETVALDIRRERAVAEFFAGRAAFDHVVVSAAELTVGALRKQSLAEAREAVESKFWGAVNVAHAANIAADGSLTLVSGMLGCRPSGNATILSAVNAALDTLARALATEMAPIRVNCISPGRIDSPWWDYLSPQDRESLLLRTASALPLKRVGAPVEIAGQIIHAMQNGFMTGSVIQIDGGGSVA
jgi:NAD(P)-dependent dehydrogenase (short-subunit alcohol dehydrogenase family)